MGSRPSVAIAAYITWLSEGQPIGMNADGPHGPFRVPDLKADADAADATRGEAVYADRCAYCHGDDGAGLDGNPPVWGAGSYNDGAGLARVPKLANWLKVAMPLGDASLSAEQARDVAAFVNSHPRPAFVLEEHLPPPERLGDYNAGADDRRPGPDGRR